MEACPIARIIRITVITSRTFGRCNVIPKLILLEFVNVKRKFSNKFSTVNSTNLGHYASIVY